MGLRSHSIGGWIYARQINPSDDYLTGFPTISQGIFIPPGSFNSSGVYTNAAVTANNFNIRSVLNTFWTGARWKMLSDLEATVGFYYQDQNNFNTSPCTRLGRLHQQQQVRRKPGRTIVPARLEASQACRHLRRRPGQQCLRRPRQRLLLDLNLHRPRNEHDLHRQYGPDAELRPDRRHSHPLLTGERGPPERTLSPACCRRCSPCCSRSGRRSARLRRPCHPGRARYAAKPIQAARPAAPQPRSAWAPAPRLGRPGDDGKRDGGGDGGGGSPAPRLPSHRRRRDRPPKIPKRARKVAISVIVLSVPPAIYLASA